MRLWKGLIKKPWPYLVGGIILAVLNIILFSVSGKPWRITTGFLYWGMGIIEKLGFDNTNWYYFSVYGNQLNEGETFFNNQYTILGLSVIAGALEIQ